MLQNIDTYSLTQKYDIGFGLKLGGKVYHYAEALGILTPAMGAKAKNPQELSQTVLGAAALAGSKTLVLGLDNTDGPTYNGLLPKDYLRKGTVVVFAALGTFVRQILSNTAVTVNAGIAYTTVTLDAPIPCNVAVTDVAEAIASPYKAVVPYTGTKLSDELSSTVGIPTVACPANSFLFLQTWGPSWVSPDLSSFAAANRRTAVFGGDGAIADCPAKLDAGQQFAGYVMGNDKAGTQGAPFFMLMIDALYDVAL